MKIKLFRKIALSMAAVLSLSLVSCATSVKVDVVRPAELDLNGAQSIAVLPFRPSLFHVRHDPRRGDRISVLDFFFGFDGVDVDEEQSIRYLKNEIEEGLITSPYLKLISSSVAEQALRNSEEVPADVFLTGEVLRFDVEDRRREVKVRNPNKKPPKDDDDDDEKDIHRPAPNDEPDFIFKDEFRRHVVMEFLYQIVDSKTDEIISFSTVTIDETSLPEEEPRFLPKPFDMIKSSLDSKAKTILREIQPYTVTKYLSLLKYKNHSGMKYADDLADDGFVSESYDKFYEIYQNEGIFEAGYNAAMLLEALGRLDEAEELMTEVSQIPNAKNSKKALSALYDIKNEIKQAERLEQQNQDREGTSEVEEEDEDVTLAL